MLYFLYFGLIKSCGKRCNCVLLKTWTILGWFDFNVIFFFSIFKLSGCGKKLLQMSFRKSVAKRRAITPSTSYEYCIFIETYNCSFWFFFTLFKTQSLINVFTFSLKNYITTFYPSYSLIVLELFLQKVLLFTISFVRHNVVRLRHPNIWNNFYNYFMHLFLFHWS